MTSCTCRLSEAPAALFDAVQHFDGCALLTELDALASERLLYPSDFADPDEPVWFIAPDGRFMAFPGVDGGTRARR